MASNAENRSKSVLEPGRVRRHGARAVRALRILTFSIAVSAATLWGCKSPCRQLSEKLCECSANTQEKEACIQQVSRSENTNEPTDADNQACQALLESCDCRLIDTPEGKRACGLAR